MCLGCVILDTVQNENTYTPQELNDILLTLPFIEQLPTPKKWVRVDCGQTEVYVGDRLYIVALVDETTADIEKITETQIKVEQTVVKYLQNEGFIDNDCAYIGIQKFKIKSNDNNEETPED